MSVDTFNEIHRGRDGADEFSGQKTVTRYTRVFRATTTSNTDEAVAVKGHSSCPRIGSIYPEDIRAKCRRVRARNESFSKRVWLVTANYSTEFEAEENPLDDPVVIEWTTEQFQRPFHKDIHGEAILNTAGDHFDPDVEGDDSRWAANISLNVPGVPGWLRGYRDAINKASFVIDGQTVSKHKGKVQAIRIGKRQERNDVAYRPLNLILHIKDEDDDETWVLDLLNHGFYQWKPLPGAGGGSIRVKCVDGEGDPVIIPVPLTLAGLQIPDPSPENPLIHFVKSEIYKPKDFTVLPGCTEP